MPVRAIMLHNTPSFDGSIGVDVAPAGKVCTKCGEWQALDDYHRHPTTKDRRQSRCKTCAKAVTRARYRADPVAGRAESRRYYWADPQAAKDRERARYQAKTEYIRERIRQHRQARLAAGLPGKQQTAAGVQRSYARFRVWRDQRRDVYHASQHAARARKRNAPGNYTAEQWQALCAYYGHRCLACGVGSPLSVDHVIPLVRGGANGIDNLQPLCRPCNVRKGRRIIDYRGGLGG